MAATAKLDGLMIVELEIFDGSLTMMMAAMAEFNGFEDSSDGKIYDKGSRDGEIGWLG